MNVPSNLRVVSHSNWPGTGKPMIIRLMFDGSVYHNQYDLRVRSASNAPADDDPFGSPRRRTWVSYGGADAGTGRARTRAHQIVSVYTADLDWDGPWQFMVVDQARYHETLATHHRTDMIEWPVPARYVSDDRGPVDRVPDPRPVLELVPNPQPVVELVPVPDPRPVLELVPDPEPVVEPVGSGLSVVPPQAPADVAASERAARRQARKLRRARRRADRRARRELRALRRQP